MYTGGLQLVLVVRRPLLLS